jgi:hypothetical protein
MSAYGVFNNRASRDEISLVGVDQIEDEAKSETISVDLEATFLKRDGAKVVGLVSTVLLRQKNNV